MRHHRSWISFTCLSLTWVFSVPGHICHKHSGPTTAAHPNRMEVPCSSKTTRVKCPKSLHAYLCIWENYAYQTNLDLFKSNLLNSKVSLFQRMLDQIQWNLETSIRNRLSISLPSASFIFWAQQKIDLIFLPKPHLPFAEGRLTWTLKKHDPNNQFGRMTNKQLNWKLKNCWNMLGGSFVTGHWYLLFSFFLVPGNTRWRHKHYTPR